ncbi:hypothetical protein PCE1_002483 [Barthelona sp. PCE]
MSYEIKTIPFDYREAENLNDALNALVLFKSQCTRVFGSIKDKVSHLSKELDAVNNRIEKTRTIINNISSDTSRAITVFSKPKYPKDKLKMPPNVILVKDSDSDSKPDGIVMCDRTQASLTAGQEAHTYEEEVELFRSLKSVPEFTRYIESDLGIESKTLGSLPHKINSVSSLLLFNTSENPYKEYTIIDNLMPKTVDIDEVKRKQQGFAAPEVTLHNQAVVGRVTRNIDYIPDAAQLPEFQNVPTSIPALRSVAVNLTAEFDNDDSVAPSRPDLPPQTVPPPTTVPPPATGSVPPPPVAGNVPPPPGPGNVPPPPGPGPVPPAGDKPPMPMPAPSTDEKPKPAPVSGHGNLLADIKAMNWKKNLKSRDKVEKEEKEKKIEKARSVGKNAGFHDQLKARLALIASGMRGEVLKSSKSKKPEDKKEVSQPKTEKKDKFEIESDGFSDEEEPTPALENSVKEEDESDGFTDDESEEEIVQTKALGVPKQPERRPSSSQIIKQAVNMDSDEEESDW